VKITEYSIHFIMSFFNVNIPCSIYNYLLFIKDTIIIRGVEMLKTIFYQFLFYL